MKVFLPVGFNSSAFFVGLILAAGWGGPKIEQVISIPASVQSNPVPSDPLSGNTNEAAENRSGRETSSVETEAMHTRAAREAAPQTSEPDTLSLVVTGEDPSHLRQNLEALLDLKETRRVRVGQVFIVGLTTNAFSGGSSLDEAPVNKRQLLRYSAAAADVLGPEYRILERAGVGYFKILMANNVYDYLDISYSPTWVVRHRGQDYVFEGVENPETLFDAEGSFILIRGNDGAQP